MIRSRPLDLSKLIPTESSSPRLDSPGSPNPYQKWATESSPYAKQLRIQLESPTVESAVRGIWTNKRICDLENYQVGTAFKLEMLKKVRDYHKCILGMRAGFWELITQDVVISYLRSCNEDAAGVVTIYNRGETKPTKIVDVSGDHIYKILGLLIDRYSG